MQNDEHIMAVGQVLAKLGESVDGGSLQDHEYRVFSQFGDDGIIQFLINSLPGIPENFVEFGVENYLESNTRFLLRLKNWSGYVIDGCKEHVESIKRIPESWRHDLRAKCEFITRENINSILEEGGVVGDVGILSVDIDGNDYWVYERIEVVSPWVVICEYNSVFGNERAISVPYEASFHRSTAHFSNLYYGASLPALIHLNKLRGYRFIGSNSAGNNAYFLRDDLDCELPTLSAREGYVESKFREARGEDGSLLFLSGEKRIKLISGLPVVNVLTGDTEEL